MASEKKFISLSYDLYIKDQEGNPGLYEHAPEDKPFQFISGIGYTLDLFEENVINLKPGDKFDFEIPCAQAYGEYDNDSVLELQKEIFMRDGKFDSDHVKEGYVIPLSDGQSTFNALVTQILEDKVVVDLNHPLAGEDLIFKGHIIESRPATEQEIDAITHPKGCGGGCGGCGGGDCGGEGGCGGCGGCN
ncbi:MAG: FKBP-type peptidyl-prolyl cis-trans isomerase [Bacteroidaceae bacterium]|nr:FKBP-type peptidyl-prolyl cis-trans isomerase [Bacteroidaceae bacterium]